MYVFTKKLLTKHHNYFSNFITVFSKYSSHIIINIVPTSYMLLIRRSYYLINTVTRIGVAHTNLLT